ncbi:MAG: trimeric intracellular cation channel family protein [Muribaculaceae bacterium]|nr:trimeric intracellular cation channel family protein [Muribaculaceae bacterium]
MEITFLLIVEIIGTLAFAISGIRLAAVKRFDWFGAYIVGLVTAIGGGTIRDLFLSTTPFWMLNYWYLVVTAIALGLVIIFKRYLVRLDHTVFIFDTIGLALFVVIGMQKSIDFGFPMWVAIIMGTITGAFGGVLRDILINEEPLIFRKEVYATACIAGGLVYWLIAYCNGSTVVQQVACATIIIVVRVLSVVYNWSLPVMGNDSKKKN